MHRQFIPAIAAMFMAAATPSFAETAPIPAQQDWVDAKRQITLNDGLTVSYVEMGPPDGQPILLLHGYTDNSRSWSLLAPHLDGRRLIAMDLRGHGDSDAPICCYGVDSLASDVNAFMEAVGIKQADVVGHSLGSMTAATLAAYHPEKVDELVLISTSAYLPKEAGDWLWDNVPGLQRPIDPDGEFMMNWYWNPTPVDEGFLKRERAESAAAPEVTWMGVLRSLGLTDWSRIAGRIKAPTMILWGDQDSLFDATSQDHIKTVLPDAKYVTYAGHGHNMFWEIPQQVGADITQFLGR